MISTLRTFSTFSLLSTFFTLSLILWIPKAHAAPPTPSQRAAHQKKLFHQLDADSNGKLHRKEFVHAVIKQLFTAFDLSHNGRVTRAEFFKHARNQKLARQEYPIMDTEGKGYLILKDVYRNKPLILRLQEEFKKLDTNNKGYVTFKDLPDISSQ